MLCTKTPLFIALLALTACATHASPEDAHMADNLCMQGKVLLMAGKKTEARDIYSSATKRDAGNARAWNGLGAADDLLGKREDALEAYQHAIDLMPNDMTAKNNLAHLYMEMGQPDKAVELLQPYADDRTAPATLRQNLAAATKVVQAGSTDVYAELGSYPTDGMAQGHIREAKSLLGNKAKDLDFTIVPEVKTGGGVPTFTAKITGRNPQDICDDLTAQAFPCIPHGKQ